MPKKREKSADEFHKGQVRELKKKVRSLEKQVKELTRSKHIYDDVQSEPSPEELENTEKIQYCPDCKKGHLEFHSVLGRYWSTCSQCEFRSKTTYEET